MMESVLGKGCVMEYECDDWNGRAQGKACLRVEDWSDAGRGFLVGDYLIASDGYYEWYGQQYLKDGKGLYHLCSGDRSKCKAKLPRGDGRELVRISRWRLASILMMHDKEYSKKTALEGIVSFVDGIHCLYFRVSSLYLGVLFCGGAFWYIAAIWQSVLHYHSPAIIKVD